jgi:hypothetical protein
MRMASRRRSPEYLNREFKVQVTESGMIRLLSPLMDDFGHAGRGVCNS